MEISLLWRHIPQCTPGSTLDHSRTKVRSLLAVIIFPTEIETAETNTMYYKGVYPDLEIADVDDETAAEIKTNIGVKVAKHHV